MGQVCAIGGGRTKFITAASMEKIKTFSEDVLIKLYEISNDPIQMLLIEEICRLKGFPLGIFDETPDEPTVA